MKRFLFLSLIIGVLAVIGHQDNLMADDAAEQKVNPPAESQSVTQDESGKQDTANAESADAKGSDSPAASKDESKPSEVVKIDGVFEAVHAWELIHDHDQIQTFEIERILPHGAAVTKGQNVVWFDSEAIDQQLAAAEIQLKLAELAAADDQFSYDQFLETQKLDRQAAERARGQARQNYDNYVKVDREQTIENAKFSIKSSQYYLENTQEELTQLTQMYQEDDLTEESEEIVMKRAKQAVESAEFNLKAAKVRSDRIVDQTIPLRDATEKTELAKAEMTHEKAIRDLGSSKQQRDLKRKQADVELRKKSKDFETLREQRKAIVMTAPGDGIVLHGELTRGAQGAKPSSLETGSQISQKQVIATIVSPTQLRVRLELSEPQLATVVEGAECVIKPASMPNLSLKGVVKRVDKVPFANKKFDAEITLKGKIDESIVPTMTCSAEFTN